MSILLEAGLKAVGPDSRNTRLILLFNVGHVVLGYMASLSVQLN